MVMVGLRAGKVCTAILVVLSQQTLKATFLFIVFKNARKCSSFWFSSNNSLHVRIIPWQMIYSEGGIFSPLFPELIFFPFLNRTIVLVIFGALFFFISKWTALFMYKWKIMAVDILHFPLWVIFCFLKIFVNWITSFYVCALAIVNGASVNIFAMPGVCISNYFFLIDLKVLSMVRVLWTFKVLKYPVLSRLPRG